MKRGLVTFLLIFGLVVLFAHSGFAATGEDYATVNKGSLKTGNPQLNGNRTPGSLTTLFAQTQGATGNMFDILPSKDLEITAIDINAYPAGGTAVVEVYYRIGTCVGFETSPVGWTLMATGTGTLAGIDLPTYIDLTGNGVVFSQGQTYGIYVHLESYSTGHVLWYTACGPNTYSNSDLSLTSHVGKQYPAFTGYTYFYRIWNGTVYYDTKEGSLKVTPDTLSASTGGKCDFYLDAGVANALKPYLVMGSITGTSPGTPLPGGAVLPLNWDAFTVITVVLANGPVFPNTLGVLDGMGKGYGGL